MSLLKSIKWTTPLQKDEILSNSPNGQLYYVHNVDEFNNKSTKKDKLKSIKWTGSFVHKKDESITP